MKKIFTILLLAFFIGGNFSWAETKEACMGKITAICSANPDPDCVSNSSYQCDGLKTVADCLAGIRAKCGLTNTTQADIQSCFDNSDQSSCADYQANTSNNNPGTAENCVTTPSLCRDGETCDPVSQACVSQGTCAGAPQTTCDQNSACEWKTSTTPPGCYLKDALNPNTGLTEDQTVMGMTIGPKCLLNGQCKFNIYDALGIRTSVRNQGDPTSVGIFVQDIVLSATMFIGTIVTIAIIVSGLMRIFAGASGKDPTKAKSGLINSLIGLLIVVSSYLIIRLVQYIAKGV